MAKKSFFSPETIAHFEMWDEIKKETDRGSTIMAHAYLDNILREAIESLFVNKRRTAAQMLDNGALGTFAAKNQLLYCLGFYGKTIKQDLENVNKVRNAFAHAHKPISYDRPDIVEDCITLNYYFGEKPPAEFGPKERYLGAVSMLANIVKHETIREDRVYHAPEPRYPK